MLSAPEEFKIVVQGKQFAGQLWGDSGEPVIALHGWLDNCQSFYPLSPLLENVQILALDMAGHGHSEHRSADASYHIWDDVREVLLLANEMGWKKFSLLGHSRGAIISVMIAAVAPERINRVMLIEGLMPMTLPASDAADQLKKFNDCYQLSNSIVEGKQDLNILVKSRVQGKLTISEEAARIIVERNTEQVDGYYYWRTDPRLMMPSPMMLNDEAARSFVTKLKQPALLICADQAMGKWQPQLEKDFSGLTNLRVVMLSGHHHLHMEEGKTQVAEAINQFVGDVENKA